MKANIVQIRNPKINRYVKIDRSKGQIIAHKKSEGPYKNIPIARRKKRGERNIHRENVTRRG